MPAISRLGDGSSHGGTIISASSNVAANGIAVAREGDLHACPISGHGVTALTAVTTTQRVNGQLIVTVGAVAGCGAVIVAGSSDVNAG
jgi:uncharacterized Zn-binding protein involved in type VI secretion